MDIIALETDSIFGTSNFGVFPFSVVMATSRYVDPVFISCC